jgi:hypothetical protein
VKGEGKEQMEDDMGLTHEIKTENGFGPIY